MMIRSAYIWLARQARDSSYRGTRFFCPLCGKGYRRFLPTGTPPRANAACPGCLSLERHRLLWAALNDLWKAGSIPSRGRMLHVAPEKCLQNYFKKAFDYVSVDRVPSRVMAGVDITSLAFRDASFDAIVCNHVLEHVRRDRQALAELHRVLSPGGWASIQVPMCGEITQEDLSITDPEDRVRLYGQSDHVRLYGSDFKNRLFDAGFELQILHKSELFSPKLLDQISVECEEEIWICRKAG